MLEPFITIREQWKILPKLGTQLFMICEFLLYGILGLKKRWEISKDDIEQKWTKGKPLFPP